MASTKYSSCEDLFSIQLRELVRINELRNNLVDLYHNKIGTLYDEFNMAIPLRFGKEYNWLWSDHTIENIKDAAESAATILNEVRVKPKPYQPLSAEDVKDQVKVIEREMLADMTDKLLECACPVFYESGVKS